MPKKKKSAFGEHAGSVELLWGERERSSRGPKPGLSAQTIALAGIETADAEGLEAVSMQRIAATFGFTTMSLYRYVESKTELVDLMIEAAMGDPPDLEAISGGWREKLGDWAHQMAEGFRKHPWLPGVTLGYRVMGPNEFGWMESGVGALAGTGLDGGEALDAILVVSSHVRNIVQQTTTVPGVRRGMDEALFAAMMGELLAKHAARYPALTAAFSSTSEGSLEKGLEFGLNCIFDGLELLIARKSKKTRAATALGKRSSRRAAKAKPSTKR